MTIHFHVGKTPFTFQLSKREEQSEQELEEKTGALVWYGLHFPATGQRARYVLRKWAGGGR